jgi:hypothetical protein
MTPFEIDDDRCQPHRELGEDVVIGSRESELQPAPENYVFHKSPF